jgi:hypothetical protein
MRALKIELHGKVVAELVPQGWRLDWGRIALAACMLNEPRDCWIAQALMAAWYAGAAAARNDCPGCAHEPGDFGDPEWGVNPRARQQRLRQEAEQRTLADYLRGGCETGKADKADNGPEIGPETPRKSIEAIFAPALLDIGLRGTRR